MHKLFFNVKLIVLVILFCLTRFSWADTTELKNEFYLDKTKVVSQQIELLKNRLMQVQSELTNLEHQKTNQIANFTLDHVNKQLLNQAKLDMAIAKSNVDSIDLELTESQQTVSLLEKDTQEIENQMNLFNIFGMKIIRTGVPNLESLTSQLDYQKNLLRLEKTRLNYLTKLRELIQNSLQLYTARYVHIDMFLKSQTMLQLKERQTKYEIDFQQQQKVWLQKINQLYVKRNQLNASHSKDRMAYVELDNEIFYANENMNLTYMQMLIARYQEQIKQLKISISRSSSISLLNKVSDQVQALGKQFEQVHALLDKRVDIIRQRKAVYMQADIINATHTAQLDELENQYKSMMENVSELNRDLAAFRLSLDQALQQELSARQGLLGFGVTAWLDLGNEFLLFPTLTYQVVKNLVQVIFHTLTVASTGWWLLLVAVEILWLIFFYFSHQFLQELVVRIPDHELGHINLKWLMVKVLHRNLIDIAFISNIIFFLYYVGVPLQNFQFLINLGLLWLFFKAIITMARLCLVETMQDRSGHDVRLYHRLKWTFFLGGIITAFAVFMYQLPVIYEIKDLFYRLFLLFLVVVSLFLIKYWQVLPGLILPHIDQRHTYFKKIIRLFGLIIPLIILGNSLIGLFGYVNFVLTISWYEGIFLVVLIGYLIIRGLLSDMMEFFSHLLIRHVNNGWLWTEAFLKPINKVLRVILFLVAWVVLFFLYGWNRQSPVVERLNKLLHYHLADVLNTTIMPINIIGLVVVISLLYWAAKWTREFVYRLLLSRTKDLGLRNSIAILSQYTMIVIGVLIALRVLGIDFRALTVVAGAFAFGVGLGLRDLVNNFVCGFLLLLERPVRVGDTVSISGYEGTVMHIGGRAITVRTWDHMDVLVPNAEIFSKTFMNWTVRDYVVRSVITLKINPDDSPHDVQALIYQTLASCKNVLTDPAPEVFLKELADGLTEFEVRYFVNLRLIPSRVGVRSEVLMAIWDTFEKQGIKSPSQHYDVSVIGLEQKRFPSE